MDKDIRALLAETADGDMDSFGDLYDMLSVRVFNYARAITGSRESSEDITHDVFLQILKQADRLKKMSDPVAYIMVAARNLSYNNIKNASRASVPLDETFEAAAPTVDRLLIEEAFSGLPANQRETVYLHHVCGFTQKEVSTIMGVPLVTVKWRNRKAISQLQAYFNQEKEEDFNESRHAPRPAE